MKNLLTLLIVLMLSGCNGIADFLDVEISRDAKQAFIAASGNAIEIKEANAIAPVRVAVTVDRLPNGQPTGNISFPIGTQCTQRWTVSGIENYEAFWLGDDTPGAPSAWYVTYDAVENQCGIRRCNGAYTSAMDSVTPQLAVVTIGCAVL